jgi:hypothetical protein
MSENDSPVFIAFPRGAPEYATFTVVDLQPVKGKPSMRIFRTGDWPTATWVRDFWRRRDYAVFPGDLRRLSA